MVGLAFACGLAVAARSWLLGGGFAIAAAALLANGLFLDGNARTPGSEDRTVGAVYVPAGIFAVVTFTLGVGISLLARRLTR